ncbi:geranylgeranylglycerol-phosphate geranylgeranyltransferase [candidate division KSB1 bacterium]|nr:geranylgeranylglycerol-phosphate geranylgeranyltransferase [candidate division KSB1 bacterium]
MNVVISFLSILVAIVICGWDKWESALFACLTGACMTAAANAINDVYDLEIDRINRPYRPLPKGLITPKEASIFSIIFFLLGVVSSALINEKTLVIAVIFAVLLYLYSASLKRKVLIGNVTVSLATAFAFIFGGVAVGGVQDALFPALFAFLIHFGREIIKDMEDVDGDARDGARTMPIRYGMRPAKIMVTILLMALILITQAPFLFGIYGTWYLVVVNLGVNTVLLTTIFSMWMKPVRSNYRLLSALLKADMLVGLTAIYIGRY